MTDETAKGKGSGGGSAAEGDRAVSASISWRKVVATALVLLAILLVLLPLLLSDWTPPGGEAEGSKLCDKLEQRSNLLVQAWIATNKLERGEGLRFWISFTNRGDREITGLRLLDLDAAGFRKAGDCWSGGLPACTGGTPHGLLDELPQGSSAIVEAELTAESNFGRSTLAFVYRWTGASGSEHRGAASCGPIEVTTAWRQKAGKLTGRLHALTKDLALPLVLVLLGFWFQRAEKQRENERRKSDERRTLREAVLTGRLDQINSDNQRYYLPVLGKLGMLRQLLEEDRKNESQVDSKQYLHALLRLISCMRAVARGIGGFHFQNRVGEELLSTAWSIFRKRIYERLGEGRVENALELTENRGGRRGDISSMEELSERLSIWRESREPFQEYKPLVDIMYHALGFEMNRPFEYWYGEKEEFPLSALEQANGVLPLRDDRTQKLHDLLNDYLEGGRRWGRVV